MSGAARRYTRSRTFAFVAIASAFQWPSRAEAQFLWLPFSPDYEVYISCHWGCYYDHDRNPSTPDRFYNHRAIDYGRVVERDASGRVMVYDTVVRAAAAGTVIYAKDGLSPGELIDRFEYGNSVRIRHANGYQTRYAHLLNGSITQNDINEGDEVDVGTILGIADHTGSSSGPHLHFEVRDPQGRRVNPYGDPPDYVGGCGPNALWVTCPPTPAPPPDADGDGFTVAAGDCDDRNRDVHPGAAETCNDRDDDCDGTADNPWRSGLAQDIGNPCTVGTGTCANTGTWTCTPDGRATACNVDPLSPQPEACNGLDDDCDDATDEDWRVGLAQDIGNPCEIFWDACRGSTSGTWACAPGGLSTVCDAPTPPGTPATTETCNGIDDDCDGIIDGSERLLQRMCRQYFSVAASASVDQFGIAATERERCPGDNEAWSARALAFELRDENFLLLGEPITLETIGSLYGVSVVALPDSYAIVWLAYDGPALSSVGRLMFSRVSAVGDTLVAPTVLREVVIDVNVHRAQLHLAGGAGELHTILVEPVTLSPRWYAINSETGAITEREHLEPENGSGWYIALQHLDLTIVDDTRIAVWFERRRNYTDQTLVIGSWDSDGMYTSAEIARGEFGWTANPAIACPDETSCVLAWTWSLLGGRGVVVSTVSLPAFAVAPYWAGWGDDPREALVANLELTCHGQACVPLLITRTGEVLLGVRAFEDGSHGPMLRFTQACARCDAEVIVTPTDFTVFWTLHIPASFPSSPLSYFVATTMVCR